MPTVSSTGLGSGIDINEIVKSLIQAEGDAKKALLDAKEAQALAKISAFGLIKSDLKSLQTQLESMNSLAEMKKYAATVQKNADGEEVFSALTSSSAQPGTYSIKVSQLAKAHIQSTVDLGSASTVIGTGVLSITSNGQTTLITIDSAHQTVEGIRDAVNAKTSVTGVSASMVTVDAGVKLTFTALNTGTDYTVGIDVDIDDDGNPGDGSGLSKIVTGITNNQAPLDAEVYINNMLATRQSNVISDLIDGVTLTLNKVDASNSYSLSVAQNNSNMKTLIKDFVTKYNALMDTITKSTQYVSNESDDNKTGVLIGDATLRSLMYTLRQAINYRDDSITSTYRALADIGVKTNYRTGKLEINETLLDTAIQNKYDEVANIFAKNTTGLSNQVQNQVNQVLTTGGSLSNTLDKLNKDISQVQTNREKLQKSLSQLETRLLAQFNAMDRAVAQIKSTSDFLTQQLDNFVKPLSFTKK